MRFIKQQRRIEVRNIDESASKVHSHVKKHGELLPNTIRCIIAGPSNCGKTNVLISLIESRNGLKFENVYIYSKSLEQDKYVYLKNLLKPMKNIGF